MWKKIKPVRLSKQKLKELKEIVIQRDHYLCKAPKCKYLNPTYDESLELHEYYLLLEFHHIKKLSQGGSDTEENLITLCRHCHKMIHHTGNLKIYKENEFDFKSELPFIQIGGNVFEYGFKKS